MAGGVQAGTLSTTTTTFASELFGSTSTGTNVTIKPGNLTYTFNTPGGIVVNPSGNIYLYMRLTGGLFNGAPVSTTAAFNFSGGLTGLATSATALSTDSTTLRVTLNNGGTANVTIGVGGQLIWTPAAGAISGVNATLNTAGGTVSAIASVASSSSAPNTGTALPADLDNGEAASKNLAISASATAGAVSSSATFTTVETQKVDLLATTPGSRFTAPGAASSNANTNVTINLGSVTFTDNSGTQAITDGATDYTTTLRGTADTIAGTVTGSFKASSTMTLASNNTCTTALTAGGTGTLNSGLTTFTFSGATLTTAPNFICLTVPTTSTAIPLGTPTASFTFTKTTTTDSATTASGNLYTLAYNGSQVDVRNYVPAALVPSGFTQYVRVINTGTVSADVSAAVIDDTTGVVGTSSVIITGLASGASKTMSATDIEAVLGSVTSTKRPRLRITAPTNGMDVQSFVFTGGNFSVTHGKD
jgi:hypothetical protein